MRSPTTLTALAVALITGATAAPARAVPNAGLPPDLQRLLTAAAALAPTQITVSVRLRDPAHPANDVTGIISGSNVRRTAETEVLAQGQTSDIRILARREYAALPGAGKLTGNRRWVYLPDPAQGRTRAPATAFDQAIETGLAKLVRFASAVTEIGPTTVDGQPATAFSLLPPSNVKPPPIVFDIAPSGQLLATASTVPTGGATITSTISTDTPVHITAPPAAASVALAQLPNGSRTTLKRAIENVERTEGSLLSTTLLFP